MHIVDKATPDIDIRDLSITLLKPLLDAFAAVSSSQMENFGSFVLLYVPKKDVDVDLSGGEEK